MRKRPKSFEGAGLQIFIPARGIRSELQPGLTSAGRRRLFTLRICIALFGAGICAATLISLLPLRSRSVDNRNGLMDALWRPVYRTQGTVTIYAPASGDNALGETMDPADVLTMIRLLEPLQEKRKSFQVTTRENTDGHLARPPNILIGALNSNMSSRRIVNGLRYSFETDAAGRSWVIRDKKSGDTVCRVVLSAESELPADCAVAVRLQNPASGAVTMIAAGLGRAGTIAAGEFLTEPSYFGRIAKRLPVGWETRNLEVVLSTAVVGGYAGPPRVAAMEVW